MATLMEWMSGYNCISYMYKFRIKSSKVVTVYTVHIEIVYIEFALSYVAIVVMS